MSENTLVAPDFTDEGPLSRLPNELLSHIIGFLPVTHPRRGGLYSCALVNGRWNTLATPFLYHELVLRYKETTGFLPSLLQALFQKDHRSLKYVRVIIFKCVDTTASFEIGALGDELFREVVKIMGPLFTCLLQRMNLQRIERIELDCFGIINFIPRNLKNRIKYGECTISSGNRDGSLPTYDEVAQYDIRTEEFYMGSLESLVVNHFSGIFVDFLSAWDICLENQETLESLKLSGYENEVSHYGMLDNDLGRIFRENPHLRTNSSFRLENLTALSLEHLAKLNQAIIELSAILPFEKLHRFEMHNCIDSATFFFSKVLKMEFLTDLSVIEVCPPLGIAAVLTGLPNGLRSFHFEYTGESRVYLPQRNSIIRHRRTLEKLWLEIRYNSSEQPTHMHDTRYRRPIKHTWVEIPIDRTEKDLSALDLRTLSEFPVLKYLAAPIETPKDWHGQAPKFPKLEAMYFLNFGRSVKNSPRIYNTWARWFQGPENDMEADKLSSKLKVIAMRGWKGGEIILFDFHCWIRKPFASESDDIAPNSLSDVGFWYPDIKAFFDEEYLKFHYVSSF